MGTYISQTGGASASGALTEAIGNARLSLLCPNASGTVSTSIVAGMIAKAEAEADSILGPSFPVPPAASAVTQILKSCVTDIAVHRCYMRVTEFRNERGEPITKYDFDEAIKKLKEIASGQRDAGDEASTSKSALAGGTVYAATTRFVVVDSEHSTGMSGGF